MHDFYLLLSLDMFLVWEGDLSFCVFCVYVFYVFYDDDDGDDDDDLCHHFFQVGGVGLHNNL
jgi:hypothetical protein